MLAQIRRILYTLTNPRKVELWVIAYTRLGKLLLDVKNVFNPLNPIVHFWLHHTVHCAEKIVSAQCALVFREQKGWDMGRWVGSSTACYAHGDC